MKKLLVFSATAVAAAAISLAPSMKSQAAVYNYQVPAGNCSGSGSCGFSSCGNSSWGSSCGQGCVIINGICVTCGEGCESCGQDCGLGNGSCAAGQSCNSGSGNCGTGGQSCNSGSGNCGTGGKSCNSGSGNYGLGQGMIRPVKVQMGGMFRGMGGQFR